MRARLVRFGLVLAIAAGLSACETLGLGGSDDQDAYVERPAADIFNEGMGALETENYERAAGLFDEVERQHPYSEYAKRAILMSAFANYEDSKYEEALLAAQRFVELYPGDKDSAYAHYLIAISYYEQITDVERDQKVTLNALNALNEVVNRYPDTEYAQDARLKRDLTIDHLAGKEMEIGRYYQKRGQYVAAINRYRRVIEQYQTTTQTPEALHRLVECYLALGVAREAQAAAAVLGYNYEGSPWYADSYYLLEGVDLRPETDEGSWISRAFQSVNPF